MVPHNVIIKNYKSYGDEETKIDLSGNSVKLIYGNIGAGKTTFVDGIIWCLYGESLVNIDEVINRKNKKNCKVEFNFSIKEDVFSVIRYRKHESHGDDLIVFKNQKNISPTKKKESQELINSIIGMNHKAMISSVMFSSEIYISFLRVRESKRLEIFDSVLNMNIFKKWYDTVKAKKSPIEEEYNTASSYIDKLEYGKNTILQNIEDYKNKAKSQLIVLKSERLKKENAIATIKEEVNQYKDIDVDKEISLAEKFLEVENFNAPLEAEINDLGKELKEVTGKLQEATYEYNNNKEILKGLEEVDFSKEQKNLKIKENNDIILNEIEALKSKIVSIGSLEESLINKRKEIDGLNEKKTGIKNKICYTCGQSIDQNIVDDIEKDLSRKKKEIVKEISIIEENLVLQEASNTKLSEKIDIMKSSIKEVRIAFTRDELHRMSEKKSLLKADISWQEKNVEKLIKDEGALNKKLKSTKLKLMDKVPLAKYQLDFLNNIKNITDSKEKAILECLNEIKLINEQAKGVYSKSYVVDLEKKILEIDKNINETFKVKEEKVGKLGYYNYLMKILSNKDYGIKKYIISKMIDVFNKNINKYIPLFFERAISVEFDKNLKETIYEDKQEISFNSFSSGEKSLLDISIAFSLYMLVKDFFSADIRFLVFDEILDRNLDEEGIQAILQVINELAKENSIMVISHRTELQESFEKRIHVYKEDGFSKVEIT